MKEDLPAIPIIDVRDGGLVRHAAERRARARALREGCLASFPRSVRPFAPMLDHAARRWLARSSSPYVEEIAQVSAALGFSGAWLLNCAYQWSCTSLAREEDGAPWLARTLDWPFPGLGRYADVVRAQGAAGDYFSVTWPGYAGALTAMAPHRFAACINQAPLRRRTHRPWLRPYDLAANGFHTWAKIRHMPPDQLLRQVFENCGSFRTAKSVLEETPVARPAIFVLIGCAPGERCVIERTEREFETREDETSAANDWSPGRAMWEARMPAADFLTRSAAEAASKSRARQDRLASWRGALSTSAFDWVVPPVLNPYTRLAVTMCPARSILRVIGYDRVDADLPQPVTQICETPATTRQTSQTRV